MAAPHLLIYDIPSEAEIPNPTAWLRTIAVRINKSVWVIQEDNIPYRELQNLERAGARWYTLPFDVKAMGDITELVIQSVISEIRGVVQRSNDSCARVTEQANKSKKPLTERIATHRKKVTPIIKKMGRTLQNLRAAARTFGVTPDAIGYDAAFSAVGGLRQAMLKRAETMMAAAKAIEKREPGSPMARAARKGEVPGAILADYLDDRGMEEADKVRKVFTW